MLPLDSLVVLDLSRVLACPFASMVLAEHTDAVLAARLGYSAEHLADLRSRKVI